MVFRKGVSYPLLYFITVGQGPTALAVGAGGGCFDIFTLIYPFSPLSPSLWETARYRLKYYLNFLSDRSFNVRIGSTLSKNMVFRKGVSYPLLY